MTGTLTVKGIEKEVTFDSQAVYSGGQLMLSGTTTVTFADFGMKNPHSIVLDTENDLEVRLELVLSK
ncbi:YceI-like domain protein [compost metagenome]